MAITTSTRAKIARQFEMWCKENGHRLCAQAMMAFLCYIDVFDEYKIDKYVKSIRKDNRSFTGIKKFDLSDKEKKK